MGKFKLTAKQIARMTPVTQVQDGKQMLVGYAFKGDKYENPRSPDFKKWVRLKKPMPCFIKDKKLFPIKSEKRQQVGLFRCDTCLWQGWAPVIGAAQLNHDMHCDENGYECAHLIRVMTGDDKGLIGEKQLPVESLPPLGERSNIQHTDFYAKMNKDAETATQEGCADAPNAETVMPTAPESAPSSADVSGLPPADASGGCVGGAA